MYGDIQQTYPGSYYISQELFFRKANDFRTKLWYLGVIGTFFFLFRCRTEPTLIPVHLSSESFDLKQTILNIPQKALKQCLIAHFWVCAVFGMCKHLCKTEVKMTIWHINEKNPEKKKETNPATRRVQAEHIVEHGKSLVLLSSWAKKFALFLIGLSDWWCQHLIFNRLRTPRGGWGLLGDFKWILKLFWIVFDRFELLLVYFFL